MRLPGIVIKSQNVAARSERGQFPQNIRNRFHIFQNFYDAALFGQSQRYPVTQHIRGHIDHRLASR